ncbi:hypothetical protein EDC04DRAFT_2913642 [Pisolithus marmoratus]|nr:hypothetical protein EDC04DRAFT_2913642 [Pisolithus marmoratus]
MSCHSNLVPSQVCNHRAQDVQVLPGVSESYPLRQCSQSNSPQNLSSEDSGDVVASHSGVDDVQGEILEWEWNDESEAWLTGQHLGWLQGATRSYCHSAVATGSVHALAISIDGVILAAGGTHGIQLWNIQTRKETSITTHLESRGIVSSAIWIKTKYALGETLCYGTALGYVVFVRSSPVEKQKYYQEICARRLGAGLEVTCFAWDPSSPESSHIAVGTRDHCHSSPLAEQ